MADSPRLAATNEPNTYAAYSLMSIIAVGVAGFFLVLLVVFGGLAILTKQQFIEPLLLVPAIAAFVLSYAARREIENSEGTKTGINLCDYAWWIAVVGGLVYTAYLIGRNYAVRDDVAAALKQWLQSAGKADIVDTRNADFHRAFQQTMPPGRQYDFLATTPKAIEDKQKAFREDFQNQSGWVRLRQSDLFRTLYRNKNFQPKLEFAGLQNWQQDSSGIRATVMGSVTTPEGEHLIKMDMIQQIADTRPVWQAMVPAQANFIQSARLTKYGQMVRDLEFVGTMIVWRSMLPILSQPSVPPLWKFEGQFPSVWQQVTQPSKKQEQDSTTLILAPATTRAAVAGAGSWVTPFTPELDAALKTKHFTPILYADSGKEAELRDQFLAIIKAGRITAPGGILKEPADQGAIMSITDTLIELRVPVEMQLPRTESSMSAARGWAVLAIDDAAFLKSLNDARQAAATETLDAIPTTVEDDKRPIPPWKLVRFESDLKVIQPQQQQRPQMAPGGMPGMPG
jgi:hypothetical protein